MIKSARDKFILGDYVETTRRAKENNLWFSGMPKYGQVVGFGRHLLIVRIKLNGRKSVSSYHIDFWKKS